VTTSAATQRGDTVLIVHGADWNSASGMDAPTGSISSWRLVVQENGAQNTPHLKVWAAEAPSDGAKTITVDQIAPGSDTYHVAVYVFPGTVSVEGALAGQVGVSTTHAAPSVVSGGASRILITAYLSAYSASGGSSTYSGVPTGMTQRTLTAHGVAGDGMSAMLTAAQAITASGATGIRTATYSESRAAATASVIVRAGVLSPTVDVTEYGATGDGVTDDLAAINQAVTALQDGGALRFPPGKTFLTSDTVTISNKDRISVVGDGAIISCTASGDTSRVMQLRGCVDSTVRGLTVRHRDAGTRKNDADGLSIFNGYNVTVTDVKVPYAYSIGIRLSGCIRSAVTECLVQDVLADGIGVYGAERVSSSPDAAITSGSSILTCASAVFRPADVGAYVQVNGAGAAGAALNTRIVSRQSASQVTLAATASTTVTAAFVRVARPSEEIRIVNNQVYNSADDALSSVGYLTLGPVPVAPNRAVVFANNTVQNSGSRGICVVGTNNSAVNTNVVDSSVGAGVFVAREAFAGGSFGCQDVTVANNTVINSCTAYPTTNYGGISTNSDSTTYPVDGVQLTNNNIRGGLSYYIGVGGSDGDGTKNVTVSGNQCLGGNANNPGIKVIRTTNVRITDNYVDKARQAGIQVDSDNLGFCEIIDNIITDANQIGTNQSTTGGINVATTTPKIAGNTLSSSGAHMTKGIIASSATSGKIYGNTLTGSLTNDLPAGLAVTGSRGGNAALASLLTQLANRGLIIDSSSA
jgi:hypothetical protein